MHSTPASSPPPAESGDNGISKAMQDEEEKMARTREREEAKRDERMAKQRQKDVAGGKKVMDQKFKALEYLLSQSKVRTRFSKSRLMANIKQALFDNHAVTNATSRRGRPVKECQRSQDSAET